MERRKRCCIHQSQLEDRESPPDPTERTLPPEQIASILGAWVANGVLGFMWAAKQDATFPYPYVVVGRFDQVNTRAHLSKRNLEFN